MHYNYMGKQSAINGDEAMGDWMKLWEFVSRPRWLPRDLSLQPWFRL